MTPEDKLRENVHTFLGKPKPEFVLLTDALAILNEAVEEAEAEKWISVDKRKPKDNKEVWVYAPNCRIIGPILLGKYFSENKGYKESWTVYDFGGSNLGELVTHWMLLPDQPEAIKETKE